jgi:hypothetical protein
MVTMATRLIVSTVLLAGAVLTWSAAEVARDLGARHEAVATLQPLPSDGPARGIGGWRRRLIALVDRTAGRQGGSSRYWQGDYRSLTDPARADADDPALLIVSANAALRQAQREAGGRPVSVERLDQVLQAYASVLRNAGFDRDAAFNYEYVSRLRDTVARAKPAGARPDAARQGAPAGPPPQPAPGELPVGPTIHGRPGTHPPASRGEEFEIITPMNYGDREAQPEPTPGVKLPKKG